MLFRSVIKPKNLSLNFDGILILGFILTLMLSALIKDGFEIAMARSPETVFSLPGADEYFRPSYIGFFLSGIILSSIESTTVMHVLHNIFWWRSLVSHDDDWQ